MKIAITGASGTVGQQLVPDFLAKGASLLLVGRSPEQLELAFPNIPAVTYEELETAGYDFDILLHLAVLNNDKEGTQQDFNSVNVDLAVETFGRARDARIKRFVFVSSTHALDQKNLSPYAISKRAAADALQKEVGPELVSIYLPAVVGEKLSGRRNAINKLPRPLQRAALPILAAIRPTVSASRLASAILGLTRNAHVPDPPFIISDGQADNNVFHVCKRLFDLSFALAVLVLGWWAMIIIWLLIRLQSPGPGLFRQQRVGRHGRIFTCYKFRTMHRATPQMGTHEISASAVTSLGKFLRRTKLDELPQVLNILLNQMSLVGPRPCLPSQLELIAERDKRGVLAAKPGITGLGQINKVDMSDPQRLAKWDRRYIDLQSLLLDLKITFATARGSGSGDNTK